MMVPFQCTFAQSLGYIDLFAIVDELYSFHILVFLLGFRILQRGCNMALLAKVSCLGYYTSPYTHLS